MSPNNKQKIEALAGLVKLLEEQYNKHNEKTSNVFTAKKIGEYVYKGPLPVLLAFFYVTEGKNIPLLGFTLLCVIPTCCKFYNLSKEVSSIEKAIEEYEVLSSSIDTKGTNSVEVNEEVSSYVQPNKDIVLKDLKESFKTKHLLCNLSKTIAVELSSIVILLFLNGSGTSKFALDKVLAAKGYNQIIWAAGVFSIFYVWIFGVEAIKERWLNNDNTKINKILKKSINLGKKKIEDKKIEGRNMENGSLRKEVGELGAKINTLATLNGGLEAKIDTLLTNNGTLITEKGVLRETLEQQSEAFKQQKAAIEQQTAALELERREKGAFRETLEQQKAAIAQQIAAFTPLQQNMQGLNEQLYLLRLELGSRLAKEKKQKVQPLNAPKKLKKRRKQFSKVQEEGLSGFGEDLSTPTPCAIATTESRSSTPDSGKERSISPADSLASSISSNNSGENKNFKEESENTTPQPNHRRRHSVESSNPWALLSNNVSCNSVGRNQSCSAETDNRL